MTELTEPIHFIKRKSGLGATEAIYFNPNEMVFAEDGLDRGDEPPIVVRHTMAVILDVILPLGLPRVREWHRLNDWPSIEHSDQRDLIDAAWGELGRAADQWDWELLPVWTLNTRIFNWETQDYSKIEPVLVKRRNPIARKLKSWVKILTDDIRFMLEPTPLSSDERRHLSVGSSS